MSVHARVAEEPVEEYLEFVAGTHVRKGRRGPDTYLVVKRGGKYRVHEDASSAYHGPTAAAVKVGAAVRRFDPDAGAAEGRPATFATPAEAVAYIRRWL